MNRLDWAFLFAYCAGLTVGGVFFEGSLLEILKLIAFSTVGYVIFCNLIHAIERRN